jgi:hypothetical protein
MAWRETYGGTNPTDGTYYKKKTWSGWSETELIVQDPYLQQIDAIGTEIFIVDVEKEGDNDNIVFYRQDISGKWYGQIVCTYERVESWELDHDTLNLYILLNGYITDPETLHTYITKIPIDSLITGVHIIGDLETNNIVLFQNAPNPMGEFTMFTFSLKEPAQTSLIIMDVSGRIIKKVQMGNLSPGKHYFNWDGRDHNGNMLPSGCYYYRLIANDQCITKTLLLIK